MRYFCLLHPCHLLRRCDSQIKSVRSKVSDQKCHIKSVTSISVRSIKLLLQTFLLGKLQLILSILKNSTYRSWTCQHNMTMSLHLIFLMSGMWCPFPDFCDLVIFGIWMPIILPVKKPKTSLFQTARVAQPIELSKISRQFCTDK